MQNISQLDPQFLCHNAGLQRGHIGQCLPDVGFVFEIVSSGVALGCLCLPTSHRLRLCEFLATPGARRAQSRGSGSHHYTHTQDFIPTPVYGVITLGSRLRMCTSKRIRRLIMTSTSVSRKSFVVSLTTRLVRRTFIATDSLWDRLARASVLPSPRTMSTGHARSPHRPHSLLYMEWTVLIWMGSVMSTQRDEHITHRDTWRSQGSS
jgi:hypothetical protein